jgi:hypothetical protein
MLISKKEVILRLNAKFPRNLALINIVCATPERTLDTFVCDEQLARQLKDTGFNIIHIGENAFAIEDT